MNYNNRKFKWVSSSEKKNKKVLEKLNTAMFEFYSKPKSRDGYQVMVDNIDNDLNNPGETTIKFLKYLETIPKQYLVEVGCGSGRIYQFINKFFPEVNYNGIELSEKVISNNKTKFPKANWHVAGSYEIPLQSASQDICCSFYVLEHLVYPERALDEMLRVIKSGGHLVLIFPDFVASKKFASQGVGFSNLGTPKQKFKTGKILDSIVSVYDSRVRLPKALKNVVQVIGIFPVNTNPICLSSEEIAMTPDIDAIYVASKQEIKKWAANKGYNVYLPFGEDGHFSEHTFISIQKS